jgi:hypothetical protein
MDSGPVLASISWLQRRDDWLRVAHLSVSGQSTIRDSKPWQAAHIDISAMIQDNCLVFARVGNAVMVFALVAALGAHWGLLQSVAWTTMLAENLRSSSIRVAVASTFDGKHPCRLCKQIAAGKKSERKTELALRLKKLEFLTATPRFTFTAPTSVLLLVAVIRIPTPIGLAPPTPPPRDVLA